MSRLSSIWAPVPQIELTFGGWGSYNFVGDDLGPHLHVHLCLHPSQCNDIMCCGLVMSRWVGVVLGGRVTLTYSIHICATSPLSHMGPHGQTAFALTQQSSQHAPGCHGLLSFMRSSYVARRTALRVPVVDFCCIVVKLMVYGKSPQ